jgi:putative ABC transport system substrate-binding protein
VIRKLVLLALFCATALAHAQGMHRIGILSPDSEAQARARFAPLVERLKEEGYAEGGSLAIEWRFAGGDYGQLPLLAGELVKSKAEVIVTYGTPATAAARRATATVAIVAVSLNDAVESGFARSLEKPGGNVTGLSTMGGAVYEKRLELLLEAVPGAKRIGLIVMPDHGFFTRELPDIEAAAQKRGCEILLVNATNLSDLREGFAMLATRHAQGVIVGDEPKLIAASATLAGHALYYKLPGVFPTVRGVQEGGLLGYPNDTRFRYRSAADYVVRILKGAKAGELPIELPLKFDLLVNKKTAAALGITLPPSILQRATRTIE